MDVASRPAFTSFDGGQFRGRTLRFGLELAQEPTVGRKSGEKDRRPLANVPIVRLSIYEVDRTGHEIKLDENNIDASTLFCSVDLCSPTSSVAQPPAVSDAGPSSAAWSAHPPNNRPRYPTHPSQNDYNHPGPSSAGPSSVASTSRLPVNPPAQPPLVHRRNHARISAGPPRGGHATSTTHPKAASSNGTVSASASGSASGSGSGSGQTSGSSGGTVNSASSGTTQSSNTTFDSWPPERQSKALAGERTVRNIFGNLVSPAVCLNDLNNTPGLWFVYQDIAIRTEGVYSLRFALFDVDSRTAASPSHAPILAECFSSPLTIYAPRNHPGVPPSTKLAKHFVSQGYRLTIKKGGSSPSSNSPSGRSSATSRKRRATRQDIHSGSSDDPTETPPNEPDDDDDDADGTGEDEEGIGTAPSTNMRAGRT